MVVRRRRKKNKLRGNRSHGGGNVKNRRNSGCKGGVGRAGSMKHKYLQYAYLEEKEQKLKAKQKGISVNLSWLEEKMDNLVKKELVKKEGDAFVIDGSVLGIWKILGAGTINKRLLIRNVKLSEQAKEKILEADGKISGNEEEVVNDESS